MDPISCLHPSSRLSKAISALSKDIGNFDATDDDPAKGVSSKHNATALDRWANYVRLQTSRRTEGMDHTDLVVKILGASKNKRSSCRKA